MATPVVGPDPGRALISSAIVEDFLQQLLLHAMRSLSNTKAKRLFDGPLATFDAKIEVAYAFDLIDDDLRNDLNVIKDIRNAFAHSLDWMHFQSKEIVALMRGFKGWDKDKDPYSFFKEKVETCVVRLYDAQNLPLYKKATKP